MKAPARILAGGLCSIVAIGAVALVSPGTREQVAHAQALSAPSARTPSASDDLASFLKNLERLRKNDESVLPEMRAIAERLTSAHGRNDVRDVLAYYASLSPEERTKGLEAEAKYNDLWARVNDAERKQLRADGWAELREGVLQAIES